MTSPELPSERYYRQRDLLWREASAGGTPASGSSGQIILKSRRGHISGLEDDRVARGSETARVDGRQSSRLLTSGMHHWSVGLVSYKA